MAAARPRDPAARRVVPSVPRIRAAGAAPAPLDRRPRADRARQVADLIRRELLDRGYGDGLLPDERDLARQFGATRNAVRDALALLRQEGLVERLPGIGTRSVGRKVPHGLHRLMGLAEVMHEHGAVRNEVRAAGLIRPPEAVARRLRQDGRGEVVYIERLRSLGGIPLSLDLTYVTADVGVRLLDADLEDQDVFRLLEQVSGRRLGAADLAMEAVNADPHSAAVLGVPRDAALLMVERLTHFDDGTPVDLEYIRFRGDRLTMRASTHRAADLTCDPDVPGNTGNAGDTGNTGSAAAEPERSR